MIEALQDQIQFLPAYLSGHLRLTLLTLFLGSALSITLGILACRSPRTQTAALVVASVVQTIPGLALLAIMVPLLGRIGFLPALVALVLYSMLPILRNTVVGITGVDADVVEAARGLGMTESQMLRKVQIPLAAPVMLAGLRTASAWTVGMATLATPVGAQSLGNFIFSGLYTRNHAAILLGCAAAAALALSLDGILRGVEAGVAHRRPGLVVGMVLLLIALAAMGFTGPLRGTTGETAGEVVRVGAKPFTEQQILGELLALHLERSTGRPVDLLTNLGSTVAFDALVRNQIDLYVDYSGTVWTTILKKGEPPEDGRSMLESLAEALREEHGVHLVGALGFENAYCLAMRRDRGRELVIASLGDLSGRAGDLSLGADMEFLGREEYSDLTGRHGVRFGEVRAMDAALMYEALLRGEVDVISAYTTEGKIAAYDLLVLEDDLDAFPPYDAILLVSPRAAREAPDMVAALRGLAGSIDDASMLRANWSVDEEGRPVREVARELLERLPARSGE